MRPSIQLLRLRALGPIAVALCGGCAAPPAGAPSELERYDPSFTSPGGDPSGSMPIGNGEVGLNVWVEANGDLCCYVARTDAWSEANRLLKLGRLRVHLAPSPFAEGAPFRQTLHLAEGAIEIVGGLPGAEARLVVFVDSQRPVVRVLGESVRPLEVSVALEGWRTRKHVLRGEELQSSWTMRDAPESIEVWESPDVVLAEAGAIEWYHRNEHSIVPLTLAHQGLQSVRLRARDPLLGRTFGGRICAQGFERRGATELVSTSPRTEFEIAVPTHCAQTDDAESWRRELQVLADGAPSASLARAETAAWWSAFWARSWIFVEGDPPGSAPEDARPSRDPAPPSRVTQAYVLQRWVQACAGRGAFPIKFNGSIFTVDPRYTAGPDFDADWRKWGGDYWWQNTRLPYHPMLAAGDFEMLAPLFRFYRDVLPLCRARAELYHGASGAYFPETMTSFGTYSNGDYGWERAGHEPNEVLCPWWQYAWNQGPELVALMLDYHAYTRDERFAREELVPMAREVLAYFDSRFARDVRGKLVIRPTQALETHWHGVTNDAPTVAGLIDVGTRLSALPSSLGSPEDRALWRRIRDSAPSLPSAERDGVPMLTAAEAFDPSRQNVETPELYGVFPFRLVGLGKPGLDAARAAYALRADRSDVGWSQDGQFAALLGLTDEAQRVLLARARNSNPAHRFPAMWGPNYDWLPDQTHGSNLLGLLQLMLMQCDGDAIRLLPAWPKEWNVAFRLHAPGNTVVEACWRAGRLEALHVDPPERARDVVLPH